MTNPTVLSTVEILIHAKRRQVDVVRLAVDWQLWCLRKIHPT